MAARLLVMLVALAAMPSSAGAVTLTYDDGTPAAVLQRWADASYVPTAPGGMTVHRTANEGTASSASVSWDGDEMWLSPSIPGHALHGVFVHELGHGFDLRLMTPAARVRFTRIIHTSLPWLPGVDGPMEWFADAYGLCALHRQLPQPMLIGYGYVATPTRHRRTCRLIRLVSVGAPIG